jgi:hypothetical protein
MSNDSESCYGSGGDLIICILTYNNYQIDVYLNYIAIVLASLSLILTVMLLNKRKYSVMIRYVSWIGTIFGLFSFQIGLCVAVNCAGVSVIWSALAGFTPFLFFNIQYFDEMAYDKAYYVAGITTSLYISELYSIVLWIYYAVVASFITTVAHLCAIILGLLLGYIFVYILFRSNPCKRSLDITPPPPSASNAGYVLLNK